MVKEFDWINAYDWEKLDAKKFSRERNLVGDVDKIFEGSLKSNSFSYLPKTVSFYTWWRVVDAGSTRKTLMYVLSFTDGDLRGEKRNVIKLNNFVKLAPNLRNISYDSPNPYITGTEWDEIGCSWAPSLAKAFQRISWKGTVTSLNYPFGFYNEERVNKQTTRTFVVSSVDYDLFTDENFFELDLPQDFVFEYRVDDIGDSTDMQEIADKIVEDISDETGLIVLGFYFQEKMSDGTLVDLDAESFWGNSGSGVLVVARDTQRILLGLRSWDVMESNTWGNFGGAIGISDDGEPEEALPPEDNALKEMAEEINYTGPIEMIPSFTYRNNSFTYYNYIGMVNSESQIALNQFNWEISELRWFTLDEVLALPNLHFGISELMRQEEMVTFNAPGIADEEYRTFFNKDFELTNEPQFVLFEELPVITQDDIVYMATHPTWGNPILAEEYAYCHPNYFKRVLQGIEFPTFNANMNDINFPLTQRNRHTPTILKYLEQLQTSNAPPILISGNEFIDGGHRFLAYELAGRRTIPVVDIGNLLTTDLREYLDTGEGDSKELIHQFSAEDNAQNITYDEFGQPYITLYHAGTMINIKNIVNTDAAYEILDSSNCAGSTWTSGGCAILAQALNKVSGYPMYVIYNVEYGVEHFGVMTPDGSIMDADGEHNNTDAWLKFFKENEHPRRGKLVVIPYESDVNMKGINFDSAASIELAKLISKHKMIRETIREVLRESVIEEARDSMYSSYKGWFAAESVPMADWNKLSPVELVDLISFPSDDGHGDAWVMYIPRDWPHHAVLDKAEDEINQRLRALPQGVHPKERRKIFDETYSKYFDFWYIPGTEYSITGGGYQELTQSIQDDYENDYFKEEAEKRGIPFDTNLSLEEARKYLPKSTVDWAEKNNRLPHIYAQAIVKAMIQDYLDLGRDKIFYTPLLAAAPMDAEVGTDASKESNLIAGWHRDAYANILYQQDPSQGGAPTVFFKPKEEYL